MKYQIGWLCSWPFTWKFKKQNEGAPAKIVQSATLLISEVLWNYWTREFGAISIQVCEWDPLKLKGT